MGVTTKEIPASRVKREWNQIMRKLERGNAEQILVTKRGEIIAELIPTGQTRSWDSFFKGENPVTEDFSLSDEDREWIDSPPVGREII